MIRSIFRILIRCVQGRLHLGQPAALHRYVQSRESLAPTFDFSRQAQARRERLKSTQSHPDERAARTQTPHRAAPRRASGASRRDIQEYTRPIRRQECGTPRAPRDTPSPFCHSGSAPPLSTHRQPTATSHTAPRRARRRKPTPARSWPCAVRISGCLFESPPCLRGTQLTYQPMLQHAMGRRCVPFSRV